MPPADPDQRIAAAVRAREPRCGAVRVVCVDGPAGSGKTTLAGALSTALGATPVVHMDDLYRGWQQDLGAGLSCRVGAWLLDAWSAGLPGRHLAYDWAAEQYRTWVEVPAAPVVVLEGCGSGAAGIRARASVLVWVQAPAEVCLARGLARDGEAMHAQWRTWQGHEAAHFTADATRAAADFVVDGVTGRIVEIGDSPGGG